MLISERHEQTKTRSHLSDLSTATTQQKWSLSGLGAWTSQEVDPRCMQREKRTKTTLNSQDAGASLKAPSSRGERSGAVQMEAERQRSSSQREQHLLITFWAGVHSNHLPENCRENETVEEIWYFYWKVFVIQEQIEINDKQTHYRTVTMSSNLTWFITAIKYVQYWFLAIPHVVYARICKYTHTRSNAPWCETQSYRSHPLASVI